MRSMFVSTPALYRKVRTRLTVDSSNRIDIIGLDCLSDCCHEKCLFNGYHKNLLIVSLLFRSNIYPSLVECVTSLTLYFENLAEKWKRRYHKIWDRSNQEEVSSNSEYRPEARSGLNHVKQHGLDMKMGAKKRGGSAMSISVCCHIAAGVRIK